MIRMLKESSMKKCLSTISGIIAIVPGSMLLNGWVLNFIVSEKIPLDNLNMFVVTLFGGLILFFGGILLLAKTNLKDFLRIIKWNLFSLLIYIMAIMPLIITSKLHFDIALGSWLSILSSGIIIALTISFIRSKKDPKMI